jgi:hypothetical protein
MSEKTAVSVGGCEVSARTPVENLDVQSQVLSNFGSR